MPPEGQLSPPVALELEVELARKPAVYLVADVGRQQIEIKARGVVLGQVPLRRAAVLVPAPLFGTAADAEVELPAIWKVTEPPTDPDRRVVAPETLEPYSEDAAQSEPASASPTPTPADGPRHARYGVMTDSGWSVRLGRGAATPGFIRRVGDGLAEVWHRVVGSGAERPPVLALEVLPEDADRLHHLFRKGTALLVVPPVVPAE